MSDALMALLQPHTKVPSINRWSMLFTCTLGMSLATWTALIYLFPEFPGAITLLPEAANATYRRAFGTFLLMSLSCHLTVLLLVLLLLSGSFGMRCEEGLLHCTGILFFHLILHGTGLVGGERLYETSEGRPVSVRSKHRCSKLLAFQSGNDVLLLKILSCWGQSSVGQVYIWGSFRSISNELPNINLRRNSGQNLEKC